MVTNIKRQTSDTHRYTLRIRTTVYDAISRLAESERRSTAKEIELAIIERLERKKNPA